MDYTYEYLPLRGLSSDTLKFYGMLTKIDSEGKPKSIGFKYPNGDVQVRLLDKKEFYWEKHGSSEPTGLFGRNLFAAGSHKYVTVTEGALDAASLHQTIHSPVVAVQSSSSALRDCTVDFDWLSSFERVYLAFDSDAAGREAVQRVAKLFPRSKVFLVKFSNRKDANEYLQHNETEELRNIWWNSKRFLPENLISSLEDFRKALATPKRVGIPYPFKAWNSMTGGIRTGETVLIKAKEKVGKTEVMHFIEHQLLKEGKNVGAVFLEEGSQRNLLALAGVELKKPVHLPSYTGPITEAMGAIESLVKEDERLVIYSHAGTVDPDAILDTVRYMVSALHCRYVVFDHLSIVTTGLAGEDERRLIDYFSSKLELLVKELDFALIIVMHVNDEGQTRGSRYPTKVFDITFDLSRDLLAADDRSRNTIHVTIPFSRYPGKTGKVSKLIFDPNTYSFEEEPYDGLEELCKETSYLQRNQATVRWEEPEGTGKASIPVGANDNSPPGNERRAA